MASSLNGAGGSNPIARVVNNVKANAGDIAENYTRKTIKKSDPSGGANPSGGSNPSGVSGNGGTVKPAPEPLPEVNQTPDEKVVGLINNNPGLATDSTGSKATQADPYEGVATTVYRADGTQVAAHIVNGKTTIDGGGELQKGDVVYAPEAGKYYQVGVGEYTPTETTITRNGSNIGGKIIAGHTYANEGNLQQGDLVTWNGNQFSYDTTSNSWNPYTQEAAPAYQEKPLQVIGANGTPHFSGNIRVYYDDNGNAVDIEYPAGQQFNVGDAIQLEDNKYIFVTGVDESGEPTWSDEVPASQWQSFYEAYYDPNNLEALQARYPGLEEWMNDYTSMWEEELEAARRANQYATDKSVQDIMNELENSIAQYDELRSQAAIQQARASSNSALRNASAGDLGGIGQKQYSAEYNSYDTQMMAIQLQQVAFQQSCQQQIDALKAQGRYNDAKILQEFAEAKLQAWQDEYDQYYEMQYKIAYGIDQFSYQEKGQAFNQALEKLQMGIDLGEDDMEALGVSPEEAASQAAYFNRLKEINLAEAELQLDAMINGYKNGGSNGGGGGGNPGAGNPGDGSPILGTGTEVYQKLYNAGITDFDGAYAYLAHHKKDLGNLTDSQIETIAAAYAGTNDNPGYYSKIDKATKDSATDTARRENLKESTDFRNDLSAKGITLGNEIDSATGLIRILEYGLMSVQELDAALSVGNVLYSDSNGKRYYYYTRGVSEAETAYKSDKQPR